MLSSIEATHAAGIVHRDIKPANFVMGRHDEADSSELFLIDFGLAKEHLSKHGEVYPARSSTEFRGTVPYASLAAHFKKELARKDDLWSLFFILLEFLNQKLPWYDLTDKDQVRDSKLKSIALPQLKLYPDLCKKGIQKQLDTLLAYLRGLDYADKPDYDFFGAQIDSLIEHFASEEESK